MFGYGHRFGRMVKAADDAKKAGKEIKVPEEEFVKLFMAQGHTEDQAKCQAYLCKNFGSSVLIGSQMVSIQEEKKDV